MIHMFLTKYNIQGPRELSLVDKDNI